MTFSTAVLLDASVLIAYAIESDVHNTRAVQLLDDYADAQWFMLEHVFDEVLSVIQRKFGTEIACQVGEGILASEITILYGDMNATLAAFDVFSVNEGLSFTDACLCSTLSRGEFDGVLTFDKNLLKTIGNAS